MNNIAYMTKLDRQMPKLVVFPVIEAPMMFSESPAMQTLVRSLDRASRSMMVDASTVREV